MANGFVERAKKVWVPAGLGIWYVLRNPRWSLLAVAIAVFLSAIIYFSINIGFYGSLLGSGLPVFDKFNILVMMFQSMIISYFEDFNGILLLIVSLLQGVSISVLVWVAKRNRKLDAKIAGRSGVALVLATIGLGCVPCGTSLLIPIMTVLFSTSAPALLGTANSVVLVGALCLTIYSLYRAGLVAYKYYLAEE